MKPFGPIPGGFTADADGILLAGGRRVTDLVQCTPAFLYDRAIIADRIARFRRAFPGIALHYAVKANPYGPLLEWMASQVDGFDIASAGELVRLPDAGLPVSFAGPGKREEEIGLALRAGVALNVESEAETEIALRFAQGATPKLAVRVNPPFALRGAGMKMGGQASPFGIDHDRVPALVRRIVDAGADWRGLHIYAGSQSLDASAISEMHAASITLAADIGAKAGLAPPEVNLGGGFGIPYAAGDQLLDVEAIGGALSEALARRPSILADTRFAIELGRWLVGEAGVYVARIVDRKVSGGRTFLVTDGGLHHMLAASGNFGQLLRRNYPVAIADRFGFAGVEEVTITGCLCTPLDLLADQVMLPRAEPGQMVVLFCAGAYGLTASPQAFLSQPAASEMLV